MAVSSDRLNTGHIGDGTQKLIDDYGISPEEAKLLAPYMDYVAEPTYQFGDGISGNWNKKKQAYIQGLMDKKFNEMIATNANEYNAMREDTYWQRTIKDQEAAGVSPYVLAPGNSGVTQYVMPNTSSNKPQQSADSINVLKGIASIITTALMAYLMFA